MNEGSGSDDGENQMETGEDDKELCTQDLEEMLRDAAVLVAEMAAEEEEGEGMGIVMSVAELGRVGGGVMG